MWCSCCAERSFLVCLCQHFASQHGLDPVKANARNVCKKSTMHPTGAIWSQICLAFRQRPRYSWDISLQSCLLAGNQAASFHSIPMTEDSGSRTCQPFREGKVEQRGRWSRLDTFEFWADSPAVFREHSFLKVDYVPSISNFCFFSVLPDPLFT